MPRLLIAGFVCVLLAPVSLARAQGVEGTRSITAAVGTGLSLGGNAINEATGTIQGQPSVFVEQAMSNHYSDALRLRATYSVGLDYNKEVFGTFSYGKYNGTERLVGSVGGYPLYLRFANADAIDLEGGLRYYLRPEGQTRTYVAGVVGLRFLAAADATFRAPDAGVTLPDLSWFERSTLFIFGGDAGITRDISANTAIGFEMGLRYQGKPNAEDVFEDPQLKGVNNTGSRWSLPIAGTVTVRF